MIFLLLPLFLSVILSVYGEYEVPLKTLIIGTSNDSLAFPSKVLQSYGANFDVVNLEGGNYGEVNYVDDVGDPKYNSVILTDSYLAYVTKNGTYLSYFSKEKWDQLYEFLEKYKVRIVVLYSNYQIDDVLEPIKGLESGTSKDAELSFVQDSSFVLQHSSSVNTKAVFPIGAVNPYVNVGAWYFPMHLKTGIPTSKTSHITPFMHLNSKNSDGRAQKDNWIAAIHRKVAGREELHFFLTPSQYSHYSYVLADMWYPWLMKGIFLGQRRLLLDTQIDDVLLSTMLYRDNLDDPETEFRISGSDLENLVEFQKKINSKLFDGSRFIIQMAFNGLGYQEFKEIDNGLNPAVLKYINHFFWVSHTWSHMDLTCPFGECDKNGETSYTDVIDELKKNHELAKNVFFKGIRQKDLKNWPSWSEKSLVTPKISGLHNPEAIRAILDSHIYTVVGDNSHAILRNPNNPFHTTPTIKDIHDRTVTIIPRYPTRIYFDVSIPEEAEKEHNSIYGPKCKGYDKHTPAIYPQKCNRATFKYPKDLTIDEILSIESFEVARNLFNYQHDPYMFHQANLRFFKKNNQSTCLLCLWIESVVNQIMKYSEMPILTYKMDDLIVLYQDRMKRDNCDIAASIKYNDFDVPLEIKIKTRNECVVKITKTTGFQYEFQRNPLLQEEEHYGPDATIDIPMNPNSEAYIQFTKIKNLKVMDSLPLVLVQLSHLSKNLNIQNVDEFILESIDQVEKNLNYTLTQELKFLMEFVMKYENLGCIDDNIQEIINQTSNRFSEMSMDEQVSRIKKNHSYYFVMKETFNKLRTQLVNLVTSKNTKESTVSNETLVKKINDLVDNAIDLNENQASKFIGHHYEKYYAVEFKITKRPQCKK